MHRYQAFNLRFSSELEFPTWPAASDSSGEWDEVSIRFAEVERDGLTSPEVRGLFFQATQTEWWLHVPKIAYFHIADGHHITVDPYPGIDHESLRFFVSGSCLGALLTQRELMVLQASAVRIGDSAVCFAGVSGAGKSTLAASFLAKGYPLLADGLCVMGPDFHVVPAVPQLDLWRESLKHLKTESQALQRLRPEIKKFAVSVGDKFQREPVSLKCIYILQGQNAPLTLQRKKGMEKFRPIENQIYGRKYFVDSRKNFGRAAELANRASVTLVHRPIGEIKIKEVEELIENDLREQGLLHV